MRTEAIKKAIANVVKVLVNIIDRDKPPEPIYYTDDYNDASENWKPGIHPEDIQVMNAADKAYNAELRQAEAGWQKIKATGALAYQVGGNHYKDMPIQPVEFNQKNGLGWIEGSIVKYLCRHNRQGGKGEQDIQKAAHYCRLLLQLAYGTQQDGVMPHDHHNDVVDSLKAEHQKFKAGFKSMLLELRELVANAPEPIHESGINIGDPATWEPIPTIDICGYTYYLGPFVAEDSDLTDGDLTDSEIDDHIAQTEAATEEFERMHDANTLGYVTISKCARCGQDHEKIEHWSLANAPAPYDAYAECPATGMPILIARVIGKAVEDSVPCAEGDGESVRVQLDPSIQQY